MRQEHLEAILVLIPGGSAQDVEQWLSQRALTCFRMRVGLLVTGPQRAFEAALNIEIGPARPLSLPIPADLRGDVASIDIPAPPEYSDQP